MNIFFDNPRFSSPRFIIVVVVVVIVDQLIVARRDVSIYSLYTTLNLIFSRSTAEKKRHAIWNEKSFTRIPSTKDVILGNQSLPEKACVHTRRRRCRTLARKFLNETLFVFPSITRRAILGRKREKSVSLGFNHDDVLPFPVFSI